MNKKFVVSYVLDYVHAVSVGIEAKDQAEALDIAEQAFNDALIWDTPKPYRYCPTIIWNRVMKAWSGNVNRLNTSLNLMAQSGN